MPPRRREGLSVQAAVGEWQQLLAQRTEQLERSEERFLAAIARSRDGVLVVDGDGTIRYANPAAEYLLARPASALVGSPLGCPVVADEIVELDIRREGDPVIAEMRVAETDWEGRPALLCSLRDVTQRARQLDALQRLTALQGTVLDSLPARVALVGDDGTVLYANEAWIGVHGEGTGADYFRQLAADPVASGDDHTVLADGVRGVLRGRQQRYARGGVFAATVRGGQRGGAVVLHVDLGVTPG